MIEGLRPPKQESALAFEVSAPERVGIWGSSAAPPPPRSWNPKALPARIPKSWSDSPKGSEAGAPACTAETSRVPGSARRPPQLGARLPRTWRRRDRVGVGCTHQPHTSASWSGSSGPWRPPRPAPRSCAPGLLRHVPANFAPAARNDSPAAPARDPLGLRLRSGSGSGPRSPAGPGGRPAPPRAPLPAPPRPLPPAAPSARPGGLQRRTARAPQLRDSRSPQRSWLRLPGALPQQLAGVRLVVVVLVQFILCVCACAAVASPPHSSIPLHPHHQPPPSPPDYP